MPEFTVTGWPDISLKLTNYIIQGNIALQKNAAPIYISKGFPP